MPQNKQSSLIIRNKMLISFHAEEEEEEEDTEQSEKRKLTFSMATDRQSASAANGERRETFLRGKENAHWKLQAVAVTQEEEDCAGTTKEPLEFKMGATFTRAYRIGEGPEYRPFRDSRSVPEAGRPRVQVKNCGRACTQVLSLCQAELGFFHFFEIVTGWLVPSAGQKIPVQPGWYLPPQNIPLGENRFLQAGEGPRS
jgi:hypothetical protein